ncbi:hypothetical protein QFZ62_000683 [Clavibacter sp. B3I6]|jgi:hypothetical protein|uniref:hypothetical protein n=1 Tax=Clavibacter sp. B3I6 TaxID=3042268 RepID=UPI002786BDF6|nr:hypothetical protein [Clavibacter sp. B3I6]MDQ0743375.1 hypothetical protein [Clavibacter sp. B3I6]
MPRSNRPRGRRRPVDEDEDVLTRLLSGSQRTETRRGRVWKVQPVSAARALKVYRCPGCTLDIEPGHAHVVAWRADGMMGEESDLAARRHWHTHCWKVS